MPSRYLHGVLTVIALLLAALVAERFLGPPARVVVVEPVFLFRGNARDPLAVELVRDHPAVEVKTRHGDAVATTPYQPPPPPIPGFTFPLSKP